MATVAAFYHSSDGTGYVDGLGGVSGVFRSSGLFKNSAPVDWQLIPCTVPCS
jgi:hypothetical protein